MIPIAWATRDDVDGVIEVLKEIAEFRASLGQDRWDKAGFTPKAVGAWVDRGELVVGKFDGQVVGTMLLQPIDPVFWPDSGEGEALYVHKLTRTRKVPAAKGLIRPLIAFAEEETRRRGLRRLRLDCALDERLCAIYEGLGFTRLDIWEVNPDFLSWRWEKEI